MEEVEYLCVWAWKKRGGWAGGLLGSVLAPRQKQWEYRSVVVVGHTLSYYEMGCEDSETPRGSIDLWNDRATFRIAVPEKNDGAPTPHQIVITATKVQKEEPVVMENASTGDGGTVDAVGSGATTTTTNIEWKLCFDQQDDLMRLVSVINRILEQGGAFKQKDVDRFEHDFVKGDHIYRWEMIVMPPVIYPIQIHAIVLEAGRNIIVIADFGLTGYAKKKDSDFHHAEDNDEAMQEQILAAFRKLRPTDSTQRLNISTLTDQREIRKWFKAGYDEESMLAKVKAAGGHHHIPLDKIGKIFKRNRLNSQDSSGTSPSKEFKLYRKSDKMQKESRKADSRTPFVPLEEMDGKSTEGKKYGDLEEKDSLHKSLSSDSTGSGDGDETPEREKSTKQAATQIQELPQSDPVEIVLARANFCLENMDLLPPYHVFFSNSECIAVWCKTGRWSTLQTAVWCSTNSVGALKTSTLTTIGVAAANPLLAPVIAIGGLLWVSAPMLILQKSRVAWEEYTQQMTDLFWESAPNKAFVAAVENWTTILKLQAEKDGLFPTSPGCRKKTLRARDSFPSTSSPTSSATAPIVDALSPSNLNAADSSRTSETEAEKKAEGEGCDEVPTDIEFTKEEIRKPLESEETRVTEKSAQNFIDPEQKTTVEDVNNVKNEANTTESAVAKATVRPASSEEATTMLDEPDDPSKLMSAPSLDDQPSVVSVERHGVSRYDDETKSANNTDNNNSTDLPSKPKTFRILNANSSSDNAATEEEKIPTKEEAPNLTTTSKYAIETEEQI